jgi:hypothetical protein
MFIMTDKKELAEAGDKWLSETIQTYAEQVKRYADDVTAYAEGVRAVQAEIDRRNKGERSGESFVTEAIRNDNVTVEYDDEGQAVIYTGYYDKERANA